MFFFLHEVHNLKKERKEKKKKKKPHSKAENSKTDSFATTNLISNWPTKTERTYVADLNRIKSASLNSLQECFC